MGNYFEVPVKNETPYTWHYTNELGSREASEYGTGSLWAKQTKKYWEYKYRRCCLNLKYEDQRSVSLSYQYSYHDGYPTFTIRESWDRSLIELHCSTTNKTTTCPNYAWQEERQRQEVQRRHHKEMQRQEAQQRQLETMRRLERLEREKRIEEQISKENEEARRRLSKARSKLDQRLSLREEEGHCQHTHVLQQVMKDHAADIERDEMTEIEDKFKELLLDYQISDNECWPDAPFEDRMKNLQNELTVQYCHEHNLSAWSLFTLENITREFSLTERFSILKAVTLLTLVDNPDVVSRDVHQLQSDNNHVFLLRLLEHLGGLNPTLAAKLLLAFLESFVDMSQTSKDRLSQILFSNTWTTVEIVLFLRETAGIGNARMDLILQTVQTYRLDFLTTLSALRDMDPTHTLKMYAGLETDKDIDSILSEMQDANYPDKFLSVMEDVLGTIAEELSKHRPKGGDTIKLSKRKRRDVQNKTRLLDFAEPDITILSEVLISMCLAVRDCSAITTQSGENIEGYFPRLTQLASLLMLLLSQSTADKGCLLEIGTGEGKSCILAMFAVIQAIRGATVDIVTSSVVLAHRDQEEWRKLYDMFDITSSVVPPRSLTKGSAAESHDKRLQYAYNQQIVYGTVVDFAADTLRQEFEKIITRGEREFDLVIVDEVDYMTLDSGVQVTFLSHETSGMRHVEQILATIWLKMSTCQPINMEETGEIEWITGIHHFHKAAKMAVVGSETSETFTPFDLLLPGLQLGFYTQEVIDGLMQDDREAQKEDKSDDFQDDTWKAIEAFMTKVGVEQQYDLLSIFETALDETVSIECYTVADNKATPFGEKKPYRDMNIKMLLLKNGRASEIMSEKSLIDACVHELKAKIKYSDQCQLNSTEAENFIMIPFFLRKYIENRLPVFVGNALKAIAMTQRREYMIDMSSAAIPGSVSDSDEHLYHAIIPVDYQASGVLEKNKRWGDGLQQFLEMKHQLAVTSLSSVTNYMSNNHYFQRYLTGRGIFGVSGTLGGNADKDFLKKHYKTDSYSIPAHRHNKLVELPALQVSGDDSDWTEAVCDAAWRVADRGQVVLVVCEDVKTANEFHKKMDDRKARSHHPITMYTISERDNIEQTTFRKGNIIIATNLGGRGTDIKVEQEVNQCGGLFVLLTHFPGNRRVEKQVFGRTARKGNPGMVQMILYRSHQAPAYQGQSVEVMRELREEYEIQRIAGMENNELLKIAMKEQLFSTFCKFLNWFDSKFTKQEKEDLLEMKASDVEKYLGDAEMQGKKLDYKPALNALKESWALWLILHEQDIESQEDLPRLKADLLKQLRETSGMVLRGQSNNFYDHLKQAIVRTNLHCRNKTKSDYGAKSSWQKVADCDPFYRAVSLYNQAYITINLSERGYKAEAIQLLEEAKKTLHVYVSETNNTAMACQMAMRGNFEPHHGGFCNFQNQMQSRMNIFNAWVDYIDNALKKLRELVHDKSHAITEDSSVYALSDGKDHVSTNELKALYEYGLGIVFEVKQKPQFNMNALWCCLLGCLQVFVGVCVCALSFGSVSQIGLVLITEGVSDIISGIDGMRTGVFSWASWAISKSISICVSLVTAGFGAIKRACQSVWKTTNCLLNGTKTLSSVARGVIESGKQAFTWMSAKGAVMSMGSSVSRYTVKNLSSNVVIKQTMKQACKYAGQELVKQGVVHSLNCVIDAAVPDLLKTILDNIFKEMITYKIKNNEPLNHMLTEFVCTGVSKLALETENTDFKIGRKNEEQMTKFVKSMSGSVIPELVTDCTKVPNVVGMFTVVSGKASKLLNKVDKESFKYQGIINASLLITKYSTLFYKLYGSIPTEKILNDFVPKLTQEIEKHLVEDRRCNLVEDCRRNIPDVKRLKDDLLGTISNSVCEAFSEACAKHMTTILKNISEKKMNEAVGVIGKAASHALGRYKTEDFFQEQRQRHAMKSASKTEAESLSEEDSDVQHYVQTIGDINRPASELDIYILTKGDLLEGKGIIVLSSNKDGKPIYNMSYPGTDPSAGNITLKLTREPDTAGSEKSLLSKLKDRVQGVQTPHTGHYTVVHPDGRETPVNSEGQNCLYHAVIQATSGGHEQNQQAVILRNKVQREVQENFTKYGNLVKIQKLYDEEKTHSGEYAIVDEMKRQRTTQKTDNTQYFDAIASVIPLGTTEYEVATTKQLGYVGTYKELKDTVQCKSGELEKDHIIPMNTMKRALDNQQFKNLKQKNKNMYYLVKSTRTDQNGEQQLTMQVLYRHHRTALTTGCSTEARQCRTLLADTLLTGDAERLVKQCIIMGHPGSCHQLRRDTGIDRTSRHHSSTRDFTDAYYKAGYSKFIDYFQKMDIIDQNQSWNLQKFVSKQMFLYKNTPEYKEIRQHMNAYT